MSTQDLASALMGAAVDAIIVIDDKGIIQQFSDSAQSLFGYAASEVMGRNVSILMPEPDARNHDQYIENYKHSGNGKIIGIGRDVRGQKKNGETFPMHLSVGESKQQNQHLFVGICHDLSDYTNALNKLASAEQRYREIVQAQKQFILRLDSDFRITFANASFTRALGTEAEDIIGAPISVFFNEPGYRIHRRLASLFSDKETSGEIAVKVTMNGQDGSQTLVEWSFRRTSTPSDDEAELQGFGIDVSEQERALEQAHYLRTHDPLTGLLNKQSLVQDCRVWFKSASLSALLYLDIEHFSLINQRYGYEIGDAVLIKLANRISRAIQRANHCARTGADKFLIAVHVSSKADAEAIAERLIEYLSTPFKLRDKQLNVRATVGIAMYPSDSENIEVLPELAESAKDYARRRNRRIGIFDFEHHRVLHRQMEIEQDLKDAIEDHQLEIFLQPKYWVSNCTIAGFEALVRWQHPREGFISPGEFVPIAEKSSLGLELDRYVMATVFDMIARARSAMADFPPVAINITPAHFSQVDFQKLVLAGIAESGIPIASIELEITEGAVMEHSTEAQDNLDALREKGVRIAIDDFGTGYSSLNYLRFIGIDDLKIDKTFVDEILTNKGGVIIKSIIDIAAAHNIQVVAEGVETDEQLQRLREMGCHLCQGYLLSKPLPADEAINLFYRQSFHRLE
ncbi:MAG: sensor domain-containing protein [Marinobacter sp.]